VPPEVRQLELPGQASSTRLTRAVRSSLPITQQPIPSITMASKTKAPSAGRQPGHQNRWQRPGYDLADMP
jgi:hypothetical protein